MTKGNKKNCEKLLLLSFKSFQKFFFISHKIVTQLAILNTTPIFLIKHILKLKKKRKEKKFLFLLKKNNRISFAIKNIIADIKKKCVQKFYANFKNDLLLSAQKKSVAVKKKLNIQEEVFAKKKLKHFKWF